jgi:hypothetical protein
MAESLAAKPVLTDATSQHPASTATEQIRPNAINSSPAEILPTRILRVETTRYTRKPQTLRPAWSRPGL